MKKVMLVLFCLFVCLKMVGQLPSDFRSEQIFMSLSTSACAAGDTVGVEGVVTCLAQNRVKPYSRYVYVELIDNSDSLLSRQKVACADDGYFHTRIQADPMAVSEVCYVRAYTNLMRNFSEESFTVRPLLVNISYPKRKSLSVEDVKCTVAPSGGKLVPGGQTLQSVTILLTDNFGFPVQNVPVAVEREDGEVLYSGVTSLSGQTVMWLIPKEGKCLVRYTVGGESKSVDLPDVSLNSVKLQGQLCNDVLKYAILNAPSDLQGYSICIYDRNNGVSNADVFKAQGQMKLNSATDLLTIFLLDSAKKVVAECTVISEHKDNSSLVCADSVKVGGMVDFDLAGLDTTQWRVMARLLPADDFWASHAECAIKYEADYASPLPFPMCYFEESSAARAADLQAWLSTATFKRFNISDAVAGSDKVYRYMPETVMSFSGWVENDMKRPMKRGTLVAYNMSNDFVYDAPIDSVGHFVIGVDNFADKDQFFLQAVTAKGKPVFATVHIDDDTYPPVVIPNRLVLEKSHYMSDTEVEVDGSVQRHQLPNVVVKARLRTEKPVSRNKFYRMNYEDRESIEQHNYLTLLDIIKAMPGLQVVERGSYDGTGKFTHTGYMLVSSRGFSLFSGNIEKETLKGNDDKKNRGMPIIFDGIRMDAEQMDNVLSTPAVEIEEVELLRPWQTLAYMSGGIEGAVLVKTRGYKDAKVTSRGTVYTPFGLTVAPAISKPLRAEKPGDYRLVVDAVSDFGVKSYEKKVTVVE